MKHENRPIASRGNATILTVAIIFTSLLFGAFAVDMAKYYATQNQLQTAATAAALSGTQRLFSSLAQSETPEEVQVASENEANTMAETNLESIQLTDAQKDIETQIGYYDFAESHFSEDPSDNSAFNFTGGYNAYKITVKANNFGTIFAKLFNIDTMSTAASATAVGNNQVGSVGSGVRPVYVCQEQVSQAMADGVLENNTIRVYGKKFYIDGNTNLSSCPPPGAGNWGFADLRDSAPGAVGVNTLGEWFETGYPGTVYANRYYSTQPGNSIKSNNIKTALAELAANETVIILPVINNDYTGNGSNTQVYVVGFVGFVITSYNLDAPSEGSGSSGKGKKASTTTADDDDTRYIEGYFTRTICTKECTYSEEATPGTVTTIKLI